MSQIIDLKKRLKQAELVKEHAEMANEEAELVKRHQAAKIQLLTSESQQKDAEIARQALEITRFKTMLGERR